MDLYRCDVQTVAGFGEGLARLGGALERLELYFGRCAHLRDVDALGPGLAKLARTATMRLDFRECPLRSEMK